MATPQKKAQEIYESVATPKGIYRRRYIELKENLFRYRTHAGHLDTIDSLAESGYTGAIINADQKLDCHLLHDLLKNECSTKKVGEQSVCGEDGFFFSAIPSYVKNNACELKVEWALVESPFIASSSTFKKRHADVTESFE